MATIYWAIGHDNQGTVAPLTPQPARSSGITHGGITYGGGARSYPQGDKKIMLAWNVMQRDSYPLLRVQLGLDEDTLSVEGTIAFLDDDGVLSYWNASAQFDENIKRPMSFWRDFELNVLLTEALAAP